MTDAPPPTADKVWYTTDFHRNRLPKPFHSMINDYPEVSTLNLFNLNDEQEAAFMRLVAAKENAAKGLPHNADDVPKGFAVYRGGRLSRKLPEYFTYPGGIIMSERYADCFRSVDLGHGAVYPVALYDVDRVTRVDERPYFILVYGWEKEVFLPEHSIVSRLQEVYDFKRDRPCWTPKDMADDLIAVSRNALAGPDVWTDPYFRDSIFLSDRLVEKLRAAKANEIQLSRCRVI